MIPVKRRRDPFSWLLDASIFFSFDASGYRRHKRQAPDPEPLVPHAHFVITGGNSGLGFALADQLLEWGGNVTLICRDRERGQRAVESLSQRHQRDSIKTPLLMLKIADLGDLEAISRVSVEIGESIEAGITPPISGLIHNAGLLPLKREFTSSGHELTVGVHLIGPMRLTDELFPYLASSSRIIWMSSGGMYTAPLSIRELKALSSDVGRYDGVRAYALTKRAQVELASLLHTQLSRSHEGQVDVQSTHPGWVDTPGIEYSLATFHRRMRGRLRTSAQGANPTAWLATLPSLSRGDFWFDWMPRSPYLLGKRPQREEREALWEFVCEGAGINPSLNHFMK